MRGTFAKFYLFLATTTILFLFCAGCARQSLSLGGITDSPSQNTPSTPVISGTASNTPSNGGVEIEEGIISPPGRGATTYSGGQSQ